MCGTCGCSSGALITLLAPDRPVPAWLGGGRAGLAEHERRHPAPARNGHSRDSLHAHEHGPEGHEHVHVLEAPDGERTIELQQKVLAKNDELAEVNRQWLRERGILAINLMSSAWFR